MTPADGDGPVMSNRVLAELELDDATRADFAACWDILCAAPPPELAERHIHAAAALAAKAASHPRLPTSGRSLARAAVISAAAFIGTTGLAAADVLPPAAVRVVETVANTVRNAVDPIPPELSTPTPEPAPATVRATGPAAADAAVTTTTPATTGPSTTVAVDSSTSAVKPPATTVTSVVADAASTTTTLEHETTTTEAEAGSTTTTTVPDDGTAVAAGTGSTTTTTPGSTTTTEPSSTTTTTPPATTTP